jgi:predicted dehydrogenase
MKDNVLRWGIIGPGKISDKFVEDLSRMPQHAIVAVASRDGMKARHFAVRHQIPKSYDQHTALFNDQNIDIVYIGTPHHVHADLSIQAMKNGKHVLCEKPLAVNKQQVQEMILCSKENNVFLMEALWSRFNPSIVDILSRIKNGEIGDVNYIHADFSFAGNLDDHHSRLVNMDLAGGALLDVGIYPIFLCYAILGLPNSIQSSSRFHQTGADIQTAAIFTYDHALAHVMGGFASTTDSPAAICGTKGRIEIHSRWHDAGGYTVIKGEAKEVVELPTIGHGFMPEIDECYRMISQQKIESVSWSHQASLDLISVMDEIREQVGLRYPFES